MRPLNLVIEAIIKIVKLNELKYKKELLTELRKIESVCNVEDLNKNQFLWAQTSSLLKQYVEPLDTDWKQKIGALYLGKEDHTKYL